MTAQTYRILEDGGKERTALGKALFLAQKALAIAEIIMNTEVAASKAGAQLGLFGIPMAALIRAQGYAAAGTVAGQAIGQVAGGRQYGGPVNSGDLYRINEGGKPEMFTAANGNQYMMPTVDGKVTPAGQLSGGGMAKTVHVTQVFNFSQPQDNRTMQQLGAAASRGIGVAAARNN
jgi:SLT domain-containing protein